MRSVVLVFLDGAGGVLGGQVGETIDGNGTWEEELNFFFVSLGAVGRQHEQLHGAFHVNAVGLLGGHFGLGGEGGSQVKDKVEVAIVKELDLIDQVALDVFRREREDGRRKRRQVGGDDAITAALGQGLYQGLTDLTTCAGYQDSFISHRVLLEIRATTDKRR